MSAAARVVSFERARNRGAVGKECDWFTVQVSLAGASYTMRRRW